MNKLKPLHNSSIRHSVLDTESNKHLIILDSRFRGNNTIADFTQLCKSFKFKPILAVILCFFFFSPAFAKPPDEALNAVLTSAEATFKAMKEKNYPAIWKTLTAKTKNSAVDAVYKASRKEKVEYQKEIIIADFEKGGELAKAYWDG